MWSEVAASGRGDFAGRRSLRFSGVLALHGRPAAIGAESVISGPHRLRARWRPIRAVGILDLGQLGCLICCIGGLRRRYMGRLVATNSCAS